MAIGTTIDGLNTVTSLTAQDKVPVWDNEATGEPTKNITAQNFASSVKTLGSLLGTSDVVDNLTSTDPTKVLAAPQGKALNDKITNHYEYLTGTGAGTAVNEIVYNELMVCINFTSESKTWNEGDQVGVVPSGLRPPRRLITTGSTYGDNVGVQIKIETDGTVKYESKTGITGRISFLATYMLH